MKTTSNTVGFATTIDMKKFYKDNIKTYKFEREKLINKLSKACMFRFLYIYILNRKIEALTFKIIKNRKNLSLYLLKNH